METTRTILAYRLDEVKTAVAALSRKAQKLGLGSVEMLILGQAYIKRLERFDYSTYPPVVHKIPATVMDIRITGPVVEVKGYEFLGVVTPTETGNIVSNVPGSTADLSQYRNAPIVCQHCNINRARKETFVIRNTETGEMRQIGRNCLALYIGGLNPEHVSPLAGYLRDITDFDGESFIGGAEVTENTAYFLALVCKAIRRHGWCSRANATFDNPATADIALGPHIGKPEQEDIDRAEHALTWGLNHLRSKGSLGDYEYNLLTAISATTLERRTFGFAASLISYVEREQSKAVETAKVTVSSEHKGTVGKRETFNLTCLGVFESSGYYGITYIHKFADATGARFSWFSSSEALERGKAYRVVGTVKDHGEYKGVKETRLTRCKATVVEA